MKVLLLQTSRNLLVAGMAALSSIALCAAAVALVQALGVSHSCNSPVLLSLSSPLITPANADIDATLPVVNISKNKAFASKPQRKLYAAKTAAKVMNVSSEIIGEPSLAGWKTVTMRVTAYCPCTICCGEYAAGITANGHSIRPGDSFAAADRQYPFGTELRVPGYNDGMPIKVIDRGSAIVGDKLDVFFPTHSEARKWGVKYLEVKVKLPMITAKAMKVRKSDIDS